MTEMATNNGGSLPEQSSLDAACKGTGVFLPKTSTRHCQDDLQKGFVRSSGSDITIPQHKNADGTGSSGSKSALPRSVAGGSDYSPAAATSALGSAFADAAMFTVAHPHRKADTISGSSDSTLLRMAPPPPPPPPPGPSSSRVTAVSTTSGALPGSSPSEAGLLSCSPAALRAQQQQGMAAGCESPLHAWLSNKAVVTQAAAAAGCSPGRFECRDLSGQMSSDVLAVGPFMELETEFDGFSADYAVAADDVSSLAAAEELGGWVVSSPGVTAPLPYMRSGSSNSRNARCISSSRAGPVICSADYEFSKNNLSSAKLPDTSPVPAACIGSYTAASAPINAMSMASSAYEREGNLNHLRRSCSSSAARQQQLAMNNVAGTSPSDYFQSWDSSLAGGGPRAVPLAPAPRALSHAFSADQNVLERDAYSGPVLSSQQRMPATAHNSVGQQKQLQLPPIAVRTSSGSSSSSFSSGGAVSPSIAQRQEDLMQAIDAELCQLLQLREQVLASKAAVAAGYGSSGNSSNMAASGVRPAPVPKALEPTAAAAAAWPYSASLPGNTAYDTHCVQDQMMSIGSSSSMNLSTHLSAPAASSLALDSLQLALAVDAGMLPSGMMPAETALATWESQRPYPAVSSEGLRMQVPGAPAAAAVNDWASGGSLQQLQRKAAIRAAADSKLEQLAAIQAMQNELAEQLLQLLPYSG